AERKEDTERVDFHDRDVGDDERNQRAQIAEGPGPLHAVEAIARGAAHVPALHWRSHPPRFCAAHASDCGAKRYISGGTTGAYSARAFDLARRRRHQGSVSSITSRPPGEAGG